MKGFYIFIFAAFGIMAVVVNLQNDSSSKGIPQSQEIQYDGTNSQNPDNKGGASTFVRSFSAHRAESFQPVAAPISLDEVKKIMREAEILKIQARERQYKEIIEKDIAAGLNAEMRAKEDRLKSQSRGLMKGMGLENVLQLMGQPDRTDSIMTDRDGHKSIGFEPSLAQVPSNSLICFSYWPRVGVPFDGRNGQGYQVLYLQFNNQQMLETWEWQQPLRFAGIGNSQPFWDGPFEVSPPPPEYVSRFPADWGYLPVRGRVINFMPKQGSH